MALLPPAARVLSADLSLPTDRTLVMGVLNVTPDSFSDGGAWATPHAAIETAYRLRSQGADIIDIGGESTRPGARPLTWEEEWDRIQLVVRELIKDGFCLSIDTYHSQTAARAAHEGAQIINDVTGGNGDPQMYEECAKAGVYYICQHMRGTPQTMTTKNEYPEGVGQGVLKELMTNAQRAAQAGLEGKIILDPGFGFAKEGEQNWQLAASLPLFVHTGMPVLVGVSRKRFLADICIETDEALARDDATAAFSMYASQKGAWAVRVHNVHASSRAIGVWEKISYYL